MKENTIFSEMLEKKNYINQVLNRIYILKSYYMMLKESLKYTP